MTGQPTACCCLLLLQSWPLLLHLPADQSRTANSALVLGHRHLLKGRRRVRPPSADQSQERAPGPQVRADFQRPASVPAGSVSGGAFPRLLLRHGPDGLLPEHQGEWAGRRPGALKALEPDSMLLLFLTPQVVRERLVCRTIVDGHSSYEHVHSVDVTCRFMSSLISLSPGKMEFYTEKVGETALISLETSGPSTLALLSRPRARISSPSLRSWS